MAHALDPESGDVIQNESGGFFSRIFRAITTVLKRTVLPSREVGVENKFVFDKATNQWKIEGQTDPNEDRAVEQFLAINATRVPGVGPVAPPPPPPPTSAQAPVTRQVPDRPWAYTDWTTGKTVHVDNEHLARDQNEIKRGLCNQDLAPGSASPGAPPKAVPRSAPGPIEAISNPFGARPQPTEVQALSNPFGGNSLTPAPSSGAVPDTVPAVEPVVLPVVSAVGVAPAVQSAPNVGVEKLPACLQPSGAGDGVAAGDGSLVPSVARQ